MSEGIAKRMCFNKNRYKDMIVVEEWRLSSRETNDGI